MVVVVVATCLGGGGHVFRPAVTRRRLVECTFELFGEFETVLTRYLAQIVEVAFVGHDRERWNLLLLLFAVAVVVVVVVVITAVVAVAVVVAAE